MPTGFGLYRISGTICGGRDEAGPTCSNLNCAVPQAATSSIGNSSVSFAHDLICSMPVPARFGARCSVTSGFVFYHSIDFILLECYYFSASHRCWRSPVLPPRPPARLRTTASPASRSSRQGRADRSGGDHQSIAETRFAQHVHIGDGDTNIPGVAPHVVLRCPLLLQPRRAMGTNAPRGIGSDRYPIIDPPVRAAGRRAKGQRPLVGPAQFIINTIIIDLVTIPVPPGPAPLQCRTKFGRQLKHTQPAISVHDIGFRG